MTAGPPWSPPGPARTRHPAGVLGLAMALACACGPTVSQPDGAAPDGAPPEPLCEGGWSARDVDMSPIRDPPGGDATVAATPGAPFGSLLTNVPLEAFERGSRGRELFVAEWEPGDGGRELVNGLGPYYHVAACRDCHPPSGRPDTFLDGGQLGAGILFRLRRVDTSTGHPVTVGEDDRYGGQLQPRAVDGLTPEAHLRWYRATELSDAPADAVIVPLGADVAVTFESLALGPLQPDTRISPRLAPHLAGMGLLDHVSSTEIAAWSDPDDRDGDGISGRASWLGSDTEGHLSRYGWKAAVPTLRDQIAAAFSGDMGITSPLFPQADCTPLETECAAAPSGGNPEVDAAGLDSVAAYLHLLGVPDWRTARDGHIDAGYRVFEAIGCGGCHRATLHTESFDDESVLSGQTIHPFTDLLLHDMGDELADGVPDGSATGREWRTPPLWGIGRVADHPGARFMHDGRAADLEEAIVVHGGEAEASAARFQSACAAERDALLDFLRSL